MIVDLVSAAQQEDWEELQLLLYKHWLNVCSKLFSISPEQPWDSSTLSDEAISEQLFVPLVSAFCVDSQNLSSDLSGLNKLAGTDPSKSSSQICGHVFKNGELTYTCTDCAQDGTCVMCFSCFEASIHKNHKHRMHSSTGAGYCDCGDIDAWSEGYACTNHAKKEEESAKLPEELLRRVRKIVEIVLNYCTSLITHLDVVLLPSTIQTIRDGMNKEVTTANQYLTVLYNDETHTYESVIKVLELYIDCSTDQAMLVATIVDREGRSAVKLGTKAECTKTKEDVQRKTARDTAVVRRGNDRQLPLDVKVMDTVLFAHQTHAIALLNWLNSQMEAFPALREIVGDVLLTCGLKEHQEPDDDDDDQDMPSSQSTDEDEEEEDEKMETSSMSSFKSVPAAPVIVSFLDTLMTKDTDMWKAARSIIHQILMRTVFMNYDQKVQFSKTFMKSYEHIYKEFINDDNDVEVSVVGLSVQFLTVPALARRLVAEDDAFSVICRTMIAHTDKYVKDSDPLKRFDFSGRVFPVELKRALHISRDMAYILNAIPTESDWSHELRRNFVGGFKVFLKFLHHLQGMDEVKRQSVEHQVWESEWETAFNILLRVKETITLVIMWAKTDRYVHNQLLLLAIEAMENHPITVTKENGESDIVVEVDDDKTVLKNFDVLKGSVSIHQPIVRLIAGFFSSPENVEFFTRSSENEVEARIKEKITATGKDFYEPSLRVLVLCAQSNAQLWRRNGFSLINQIHNYFSPLCRYEMFDRDILMMQIGASLTNSTDFLLHLLHRYRLVQWANANYDGTPKPTGSVPLKTETEDLSKITIILSEEFLHLLILITSERYAPGVGQCSPKDNLKREIIHVLCTGSQTFSHIQQKMSHDLAGKKYPIHEAVAEVADFKKPLATSPGQFDLKEEFYTSYNPFFMHYSKSDQSQAEQHQAKTRLKKDKKIRACAPPVAPKFTPFFENIINILKSPLLIRILKMIIERTAKRNRYSSDRLFHKALFIIGIALNEEEKDTVNFDFTGVAEDTCGLLSAMESIQGKPESEVCSLLLDFLIKKYKTMRTKKLGDSSNEEKEAVTNNSVETAEEAKAKWAAKAAEMRKKAMAKMSNMQTKFMKQIKDDDEKSKKEEGTDGIVENEGVSTKNTGFYGKNEFDEDIVKQIGTDFPVCIGKNKWKTEIVSERKVTCILCQEDESINPANGKTMVCAAFIQQSQLFTYKNGNGELMTATPSFISTKDLLTAPATLQYGVDVSTCSHNMHFECCKTHYESKRDIMRVRYPAQKMGGEYQCPLCKRLSNAAIPILPHYQLTQMQGFSTVSGSANENFGDWVLRMKRNLDTPISSETVRKKGHSRKRSHSERSLLDLEKQASSQDKSKESDEATSSTSGLISFGSVTGIAESGASGTTEPVRAEPSSGGAVLHQIINALRPDDDPNNAFYNELAEMFAETESNVASPTGTPETTPVGGATPRSSESTPDPLNRKPLSSQIQQALSSLIRPFPALMNSTKLCGNGMEHYEEAIKDLGKSMAKLRRRHHEKTNFIEKHLRGYVFATAAWQSTAHVARSICSYLKFDGKPLFGALNTRQRDCLSSMTRLSSTMSHNIQFLLHAVADMLRILCCEPPKQKMMSAAPPTSPLLNVPMNSPSSSPSSSSAYPSIHGSRNEQTKSNFAFLVQLFNPSGPRKNANLNILQVDILSLAVSLMMSIGWTWHNGVQSMNASGTQKTRQLCPDGSVDEGYVVRLSLIAHYFQIIATYNENDGEDVDMVDEDEVVCHPVDQSVVQILIKLFTLIRPDEHPPRKIHQLYKRLEEGAESLLRPIALIYHFLTMVDPPEALKDPSINSIEALFRYLGLPSKIEEQIGGSLVESLFIMWSHAIPRDSDARQDLVVQPVRPNLLIELPFKYSELINRVATFKCPSINIDESTSNVPTLCLLCGQILCSQAYCCQRIIKKQSYGACRYHMSQCSGSVGIFLRVRDCSIVLMTTRKRGCFRPAPYVDEFGEVDQGFRRGNPLHLNKEMYQKIKTLWLQQGVTEEVVNYNEIDYRNVQFDWAHF